jgi:hypothetical protein
VTESSQFRAGLPRRARIFFPRSPRGQTTEGGESMMIATLLIGAASLSAMMAGFVVMVRD